MSAKRRSLRWGIGLVALVGAAASWPVCRHLRPDGPAPLPPAPPGVVVGVPDRQLRFAAYNIYHNYRGMDRTIAEVRKLDPPPDFLLLSEIEPQQVLPMADALGFKHRYFPLLGYSSGHPVWPDVAILSRHGLFDGKPLFTSDGHTFGLWAYAVVDNRKFAIVGVHLWPTFGIDPRHVIETANRRNEQLNVILATWRDEGSPPLVAGGDFNQPALGDNYALMTRDLNDTLGGLGQVGATFGRKVFQLRIDYLLATPHWQAISGGVIQGNASDHRPVWVDLEPTTPGQTMQPTTQPSGAKSRPSYR